VSSVWSRDEGHPRAPLLIAAVAGSPGLLSLYDHHSDGSGVAYASYLTPLLDLRRADAVPVAARRRLIG
jgi:hypothetical protein